MLTYPTFVAALDGHDLGQLAADSGIDVAEIEAIAAGGRAAPRSYRPRLARALGVDPAELFRLVDELEQALPPGDARFVTDPATLRTIDRQGRV